MAKKRKKQNTIKMVFPILIVLLITAVTMGLMLNNEYGNRDKINKNVYVNGVAVGGMTKNEAKSILEEKYNGKFKDKVIKMSHKDLMFSIEFKELKAHYDVNSAVKKAYDYGKNENILSRALKNIGINSANHNIDLEFVADTSIVDVVVKKIAKKINVMPIDAKISLVNNAFITIPEKKGTEVDRKKLVELIKGAVKPDENDIVIEIPLLSVEARVKKEMLSKINTEISSYTTSFRTSDAARSGNIRIASEAIDGVVVLPGENFSMNKEVGPRVASKGYKEAHVIINGELAIGLAGGICQATTTTYNAALLANFEIVQRRGHAIKVGYVKAGRDATISGDYIDFKFKNTNKYPIYIHTIVKKGTVTVKIYGADEHPGQTVEITSQVLGKILPQSPIYINDSTMNIGTEKYETTAKNGLRSIAYRKVYQSGKLVKDELLSKDKYGATRAKILIGTKQP